MKNGRSLLTFDDIDAAGMRKLLDLCVKVATSPGDSRNALAGRNIALAFQKSSTRTHLSFWAACQHLGAHAVSLNLDGTQLSTGETLEDTGRIMGLFLDGLVIRTNGPLIDMRALSSQGLAVINAMSACEHPTQALADYACIVKHFGTATGVSISYFGEGNNTLIALIKLFSRLDGCHFRMFMPPGYGLSASFLSQCEATLCRRGGSLDVFDCVPPKVPVSDVVYCTRWQTMGTPHADPDWRRHFAPFTMTGDLFARATTPRGVFMHDLPAVRGEDVCSDVLDGSRSLAWDQAACKKVAATAALIWAIESTAQTRSNPRPALQQTSAV